VVGGVLPESGRPSFIPSVDVQPIRLRDVTSIHAMVLIFIVHLCFFAKKHSFYVLMGVTRNLAESLRVRDSGAI
jgi:hypothetical protein